MNKVSQFFHRQVHKLRAIKESPKSIAGGVAIGMFWGFTPFIGLKTILSLATALVTRCSMVAALVGVALHEMTFLLGPAILIGQYKLGYWICSNPHEFPHSKPNEHFFTKELLHWDHFMEFGRPLLVGALLTSIATALLTYFFVYHLVSKWQREERQLAHQRHSSHR